MPAVAEDADPVLDKVALVTVFPPTNPLVVNSVPANVEVVPEHLVWLLAVMVKLAWAMVKAVALELAAV